MANWKPIVGLSFSPDQFDNYCHGIQWTTWRPSFIVLHNTGAPNLAQRPAGFTKKHMDNFVAYYRDKNKWSAGPHLFIDDKQIWVFTPLNMSGVHSPSWNKLAFGVEMLGDYSKDSFKEGRGLAVRKNTVAALATLSACVGLDPETIRLHKEDKLTTHACPGKNVVKEEIIFEVQSLMAKRHAGGHGL